MGHISQTPPSSIAARLEDSVFAVRKRIATMPKVGVVLGSGLGAYADSLSGGIRISYQDLPHMAPSAVEGHLGNLCFGAAAGVPIVCMQGRAHLYEGHAVDKVVHGVRLMARLGVQCVLLTNAAGGLDPSLSPGDLMIVTDHLNLTGISPLVGANDDALGPRFPDMTNAYDADLRSLLLEAAKEAHVTVRQGIYAGVLGPQYETPAEVRMIRALGASAVGMSTVHEVIALRHMGVRVAALSCITNAAAGISTRPLAHSEVRAVADSRSRELSSLVTAWIGRVGGEL